jgi:hypothetical protein
MKAWPLHLAFATLLAGSLAAKNRGANMLVRHDDLESSVTRVASSHALAFRDQITLPGSSIRALEFAAPGCARPVRVVVLSVIIDVEPLLRAAREQGDTVRYIYIGRSWQQPDRLSVFVERAKYAALASFGLARYVPSQEMLLVESPSGCQAANGVDWRNVWNRADFGAPRSDREASTR